MKIDILQIGAGVGNTNNDLVYPILLENKNFAAILVEPNPKCFEILKQTYPKESYPNVILENLAVGSENKNSLLYVDNYEEEGTSQHASLSLEHQHKHHHGVSDKISAIEVETITLKGLISKYNLTEIDLLVTDTEGNDFNILNSYDFSAKINHIIFESIHTDGAHKKGQNYHILIKKLVNLGYELTKEDGENSFLKLK